VIYRMVPVSMTLSDFEGYFSSLKAFWISYFWKYSTY